MSAAEQISPWEPVERVRATLGAYRGRWEARSWKPGEPHREVFGLWFAEIPCLSLHIASEAAGLSLAEIGADYCDRTLNYRDVPVLASEDGDKVTLRTSDFAEIVAKLKATEASR